MYIRHHLRKPASQIEPGHTVDFLPPELHSSLTSIPAWIWSTPRPGRVHGEKYQWSLGELGFKNLGVRARPCWAVLRRHTDARGTGCSWLINNDADNALFDEKFDEDCPEHRLRDPGNTGGGRGGEAACRGARALPGTGGHVPGKTIRR